MKIELTPWEIAETSLELSSRSSRKRRKRADSTASSSSIADTSVADGDIEPFALAASFLTTSFGKHKHQNQQKKKARNLVKDSVKPELLITSGGYIFGVGKKSSSDKVLSLSGTLDYRESARFGSFLPSKSENGSLHVLPNIPAVIDETSDSIFCCLSQNRLLSCWPVNSAEGPEDAAASRITLDSPSLTLSVLNLVNGSSIIYGSCENGSVYLVTYKDDGKKWSNVEYLQRPKSLPSTAQHIATVGYRETSMTTSSLQPGSKRKNASPDSDSASSVIFYQVFGNDNELIIVCHDKNVTSDSDGGSDDKLPRQASISLGPYLSRALETDSTSTKSCTVAVTDLRFVGVTGDTEEDCCIVVALSKGGAESSKMKKKSEKDQSQRFLASIQVKSAELLNALIPLDPNVRQIGIIGSTSVAALTFHGHVLIYDRIRGVLVDRKDVSDIGYRKSFDDVKLVTDSKNSKLALFFAESHQLIIKVTSIRTDSKEKLKRGLSLADCLAQVASTRKSRPALLPNLPLPVRESNSSSDDADNTSRGDLYQAVTKLEQAVEAIREGTEESKEPLFFFDVYNRAFESICGTRLRAPLVSSSCVDGKSGADKSFAYTNGSKTNAPKNGMKDQEGKVQKTTINSVTPSPPRITDDFNLSEWMEEIMGCHSGLPGDFVNHAVAVMVEVLNLVGSSSASFARSHARVLLWCLISTGLVSARKLLQPMTTTMKALERIEGNKNNMYTSVKFAFHLFDHCNDISERQAVATVHYFLSRASSRDLAEFLKNKPQSSKIEFSNFADVDAKENDPISSKLTLVGTRYLLGKITAYSAFNEQLLLAAVKSTLPREERLILARLLWKSFLNSKSRRESGSRRKIEWLSVVCDSLVAGLSPSEEKEIASIYEEVAGEVQKTGKMLQLRQMVYTAHKKSWPKARKQEKKGKESLYQLERLVF